MFFRYPGGKSRIVNPILDLIEKSIFGEEIEFRELFFGGGSVGINATKRFNFKNVVFNDIDVGIFSIWTCVQKNPKELIKMIRNYVPNVDDFFRFKDEMSNGTIDDIIEFAFKKIVIHQTSYSGLGMKAGGPIGGKSQKGKYGVGCRWNSKRMSNKISQLSEHLNKTNILIENKSWDELLEDNKNVVYYLDPPYYHRGGMLYENSFLKKDHEYLSLRLRETNTSKWILSYDNCEEIRELYSWANIREIPIKYTINTKKSSLKETKELLISNF